MRHIDPIAEVREAAHVAYLNAVTREISTPEERVDAIVDAVLAELRQHGLINPNLLATGREMLDRDAKELAAASDMPRYRDGDGWVHLRNSRGDLDLAYRYAVARLLPGQERLGADLAEIHHRLLAGLKGSAS